MKITFTFIVLFTLLSTFRLLMKGDEPGENFKKYNKLLNFISHPLWSLLVFVFIPSKTGAFARGEVSPWPWYAFNQEYFRHGIWDGITSFLIVIIVLIWLFWLPSQLYIKAKPGISKKKKFTLRFLNVVLGFILITENNFIYNFLEYLVLN